MTPAECLSKRRELLAAARQAEEKGDYTISSRCRILASNLDIMANPPNEDRRKRAAEMYNRNRADFEAFVNKTGRYAA